MTDEDRLREMLHRLRDAAPKEASPRCEESIRRALHARRTQRPSAAWKYWSAVAALLVLLFGSLLIARRRTVPELRQEPALAGFVALPYGQGDVPLEQLTIVRVDLPPSAMHRQADLLIGQDGVARAVRFVQ